MERLSEEKPSWCWEQWVTSVKLFWAGGSRVRLGVWLERLRRSICRDSGSTSPENLSVGPPPPSPPLFPALELRLDSLVDRALWKAESEESEPLGSSPRLQEREQKIWPCLGRKGRPSRERLQRAQPKQPSVACQCCPSYVIWPWSMPVGGRDARTGGAARLQPLGVVPAAVDLPVLVEVDEVHQQLVAGAAHEAGRVPAHAAAGARRKHRDVAAVYLAAALRRRRRGGGGGGERLS
ncbi:hypothetical protein EYF80_060337 [Liparis tanakae]|uniref:Uncharacterized protein n=1 Tax=Liparis tanakae TaxID=230148 RepID=A0A4Z2EM48_9TELE|nr:hypothetical protein EYF80_060337 [Liparis tanakae]